MPARQPLAGSPIAQSGPRAPRQHARKRAERGVDAADDEQPGRDEEQLQLEEARREGRLG